MEDRHIFVSVGGTATSAQEDFVRAIEDRLRSEGLVPHTVGRNTFSAEAPLKAVTELINKCSGTVVIALERSYFPSGVSKRGGPNQSAIQNVTLPTPWNQIEAAMSYSRGLPLMVVVEKGLQGEGLLEKGYDWYVQEVDLSPSALVSPQFNGVLSSWKQKVETFTSATTTSQPAPPKEVENMTVGELVGALKPAQLWSVLGSLVALVTGAFLLGAKLFTGK